MVENTKQHIDMTSHNVYFATRYYLLQMITITSAVGEFFVYYAI